MLLIIVGEYSPRPMEKTMIAFVKDNSVVIESLNGKMKTECFRALKGKSYEYVENIIPACRNNGTPLIGPKSHASKAYEISGDCPLQTFRSDIETSRTNLQSR
jgi:hypothetical protein